MNKHRMDGTQIFLIGAFLICCGISLLYEAYHAGPGGQVMMKLDRVHTQAVSVQAATAQGIAMVLPGAILIVQALKRGVRFIGTSQPLSSWPLAVGLLVFVAIMACFWNFLLRTSP